MHRRIIAIAVMALIVTTAAGQHRSLRSNSRLCKGNPELVGACFKIHGRVFNSNGTPDLRIWHVGTDRILGVTGSPSADDAEDPIAPGNLLRALGTYPDDHFAFADLEVCPFTKKREGEMQMVCIEKAENLVIKPYGYGSAR